MIRFRTMLLRSPLILVLSVFAMCTGVPGTELATDTAVGGSAPARQADVQDPQDSQDRGIWGMLPTLPEEVRIAILDGRHEDALKQIVAFRDSNDGAQDFWTYLEGVVRARMGEHDAAIAAFGQVDAMSDAGLWAHKARFRIAESMRALGRWQDAQQIYEQEVERLRGDDRQGELADVYLGFADSLSTLDPTSPDPSVLDFDRALTLYRKVLELDPPSDRREHALRRVAWCEQQRQNWGVAAAAWASYLAALDPQVQSPDVEATDAVGERVYQAHLERARCLRNNGELDQARTGFEDLADRLSARLAADSALAGDQRVAFAALRGDAMYRIGACYSQDKAGRDRAIGAMRRFLGDYENGHANSDDARYAIANFLLETSRPTDALAAFHEFLASPASNAPEETDRERSVRNRMQSQYLIGEAHLRLGEYPEAGRAFSEYVARYPTGESWAAAQRNIIVADYEVGAEHHRHGEWAQARAAWTDFLERRPLYGEARAIFFGIGDLYRQEAGEMEEGTDARAAAQRAAIAQWARLVSKYPGSDEASRALYETGVLHETQLDELDEAVAAFQRCDFGSYAYSSRMRLQTMLEESLVVVTERTWRSDEDARLKIRVRNIDSVEVQVYPLDLESYFRKHLRHDGVEDLDLDLIAAASRFDVAIDGYRRWQPMAQEITIPVDGPGTWAVAISAGELRATTLVVRSDVDMIVKSSRNEMLLWAEDMRRGIAAKNTRFLISFPGAGENGAPRIEEVVAGEDGVAKFDLRAADLADIDDVHVFAERDGHVAATGMARWGLGATTGALPRAYIYADRSVYQPGEEVRWRAVVRDAENGNYVARPGERYLVTVLDAQSRILQRVRMDLSEFGTVEGRLRLDPAAGIGGYAIQLASPDGKSFQGGFQVEKFQLAKLGVDVEFDRSVYYRGESVEGKIQAAWHYGEPLASAKVQLWTPDGKMRELTTDAEGAIAFQFDTRRLLADGSMRFTVRLPEEGVETVAHAFLAATGYSMGMTAQRAVYLVGDGIPVSVRTTAPDGAPVGRELTLEAVLYEYDRRGVGTERVVASVPIQTSEEDGTVQTTLTLEKGGDYTLRVRGTDRFENPVMASASVFVSGDDDAVQLRVLADRTQVDVGETISLQIHNRAGDGLSLLTFEGEGILEYRLVDLKKGDNRVELDVAHLHFPNFVAAASLMHGTRLHIASAPFQVRRALQVSVIPERDDYRPGEEAEVRIEVTDQRGEPVEAEFSLAMVDNALFAQFPDRTGEIRQHFEASLSRQAEMRTESSISFSYSGQTVTVEEAILEEIEMEEEEAVWQGRQQEALSELRDKAGRSPLPQSAAPASPMSRDASNSLGLAKEDSAAEIELLAGLRVNDQIALGGGAGGRFGGRGGRGRGSSGGIAREVEGPDAAAAYWNPSVITDENGVATLRIPLPQRSTSWRLMARGVDRGSSFGQAQTSLRTRADFFVEMRAPAQLTSGDKPRVLARVHNASGESGSVKLELRLAGDAGTLLATTTVECDGDGVVETLIELPQAIDSAAGGIGQLTLTATPNFLENAAYAVERELPISPWGVELRDAAAGLLTGAETLELTLPDGDYRDLALNLTLGGGIDRLLVDEALGRAARPWKRHGGPQTLIGLSADLIGVCAVIHYLDNGGNADGEDYRALRLRAESLVAALVARQESDGSWPWAGLGSGSKPESTARAMIALAMAEARGLIVPQQTTALGQNSMASAQQAAGSQDDERKAQLLYAQALHGSGDFGLANRLYRERASLSSATLAYVTLALHSLDSSGMASEAADALATRWTPGVGFERGNNLGWHAAPLEMDALALLALQAASPGSSIVADGMDLLHGARPWYGDSAGLAVAAAAQWRRSTSRVSDSAEVVMSVDGGAPQTIRLEPAGPDHHATLSLDASARSATIRLEKRGRGEVHYLAELVGATRGIPAASRSGRDELAVSAQAFLARNPRYQGREHSGGFSSVRSFEDYWQNEVTGVVQGDTARVVISVYRPWNRTEREQQADYLMLEVPLPAGTQLLADSVGGMSKSWHVEDGRIVFLLGQVRGSATVNFDLLGLVPGEYQVLPPVVRSMYRPIPIGLGEAMNFAVLPRGASSADAYRETPDELFSIGKAMVAAGDGDGAWRRLTQLHDEFGDWLHERVVRESAEMLLFLAIEREQSNRIVEFFEILKEKNPELNVPFAQMLRVGEAYRDLGEFERAYLIFRAIVDETYGKDLKLAGVLEEQGDFHAATEVLLRTWSEYPDSAAVIATHLTLADMVLQKAPVAHTDASLRAAGRDRALLTTDGIFLLQRFLALYADDPLAADAGLNLVSAYLDLEDYATAATVAAEMAERFDAPRYSDAFRYTRAVASWYLGNEETAVSLLQGIADAVYTDKQGRESRSENRDLAIYILGQIHHARQDFASAAEYYARVEDVFSDAREVLAGFRTRDVRLEEITEARPGEDVDLELHFRNVEEAELLVYAVDLMTLYLREKNLTGVTSVNLAGIAPILSRSVVLKPDGTMREQSETIDLELDEPGAYLVICRSGALHASGLVLVSDLELEVGEDPMSGRLRVQAIDQVAGRYLRDVDVRVIGSNNARFTSGSTDPRGIFVADEVIGTSTVIARYDDRHFAFFRGERVLGAPAEAQRFEPSRQLLDSDSYFDNVRGLNSIQQESRKRSFQDELKRGREGVQVKQVK